MVTGVCDCIWLGTCGGHSERERHSGGDNTQVGQA